VKSAYFESARLEALSHYAQKQLALNNFSSIAWHIEHAGVVVDTGSQGFIDHNLTVGVSKDTIYRLYSMTKPVVSVRCLQLLEAKKLRLDDPISRWVPEFRSMSVLDGNGALMPASRPITIEDLMMHRAGLSYDFIANCPVATMYRDAQLAAKGGRSLKDLVGMLGDMPLAYQPGQRWYYSYGTDVLAYVIECVTNETIADTLKQSIFEPLGMQDTDYSVPADKQNRLADMFGQRELSEVETGLATDNTLRAMDVEESYPSSSDNQFGRGGIGLFSTISDYREFMQLLRHGHSASGEVLLSKPMLDMIWQNRLTPTQLPIAIGDNPFPGYGWGLTGRIMVDTSAANTVCVPGEGGWAGAASTFFWVDRSNAITGIVMAQYLGSAIPLGFEMQGLAYSAFCNPKP